MSLRAYASAFSLQARMSLRYRMAIIAGLLTQIWFGAITLMAYAGVYTHAPHAHAAFDLRQAMTYTWIQQSLFRLLPLGCLPAIGDAARTGAIVYDLLRPLDLWAWWLSASLAWLTGAAFPRALLLAVVAGPLAILLGLGAWSLAPPASVLAAVMALASLIVGALVSATIVMWWNILTARTLSPLGANALAVPLSVLLSGMLLPLPLYPAWAQTWLLCQPFAGISDIPIRIYLGAALPFGAWRGACAALAIQLAWLGLLTLGGRAMMARIIERLEVQGA